MRHQNRWLRLAAIAALCAATMLLVVSSAVSDGPMYSRDERFGIAFVTHVPVPGGFEVQSITDYPTKRFGAGWYSDWKFAATPPMPQDQDIEYAQLVRVRDANWPPDWQAITATVQANPGALWLIGNEPECRLQDNLTPEKYAERYHALYTCIKDLDSTAQLANGGIVEPTPLRLMWLDQVMAHYVATYGVEMPVDVWNIHMQILPEWSGEQDCSDPAACADLATIPQGLNPVADGTSHLVYQPSSYTVQVDLNVFADMVIDFREWMKENGQQQKPLIISEMGVLFPSYYVVEGGNEEDRQERGDQAIELFMRDTFNWMLETKDSDLGIAADEGRLVQRWLWFSLNGSFWSMDNENGFNGSLYDYSTSPPELTRFGRAYIAVQSDEGRVCLPVVVSSAD